MHLEGELCRRSNVSSSRRGDRAQGDIGQQEHLDVPCKIVTLMSTELPTCACIALARRSFTNTARGGDEWWVCNQCGCPTVAWLTTHLMLIGGEDNDDKYDHARSGRSV